MADDLIERTCDVCGVTDTEPHHVQYVAFNHPVTGAGVDLSVTKHIACCAGDGCAICTTNLNAAKAQGADLDHLRGFLQSVPAEVDQTLFEQFGVESPLFSIPSTSEEE